MTFFPHLSCHHHHFHFSKLLYCQHFFFSWRLKLFFLWWLHREFNNAPSRYFPHPCETHQFQMTFLCRNWSEWKMFKELSWRFVFRGLWNYLMAFRNIKLKGRGIFMKCHCRKFIMHNNTWRFSFRSSLIHFSILKRMKFHFKNNKEILELTWKVTYLNLISGKIIWLRVSSCCRLSSCGKTSTQFSIHRMFFYCMYSKCEVWMNGTRCMIIDIFFTCTY